MIYYFIFVLLQTFAFVYFYKSSHGSVAVYNSWFAPIIDALAVISGVSICYLSFILINSQSIFEQNFLHFIFLCGSWQISIHAAKFIIRNFLN